MSDFNGVSLKQLNSQLRDLKGNNRRTFEEEKKAAELSSYLSRYDQEMSSFKQEFNTFELMQRRKSDLNQLVSAEASTSLEFLLNRLKITNRAKTKVTEKLNHALITKHLQSETAHQTRNLTSSLKGKL